MHQNAGSRAHPSPEPSVDIDLEPHLPLVAHVVRQLALRVPAHVDRRAMWRHGAMGLAVASRRHGPGAGFGTTALRAIRSQVVQGLREDTPAPSEPELAQLLGIDREVIEAHQAPFAPLGTTPPATSPLPTVARAPMEPSSPARAQRLAQALRPAYATLQR